MLDAKTAHETALKNDNSQKRASAISFVERLITRAAEKGIYAATIKADFPTMENLNKYARPLLIEKGYQVSEKADNKITIRW